jgi:AcrR family transcriptional regulator
MASTASDASDGGELRERIMEAMLLSSGELGYRGVTMEAMAARFGTKPAEFYSHFASLDECYAAAYAWEVERISAEILAAGATAASWPRGLRAALDVLAAFVAARPLTARALLAEVHIAGEPSLTKRKEVFDRLTRAIDSARQVAAPLHSPPPSTALFMVSAIEAAVVSALVAGKPEAFAEAAPDLGRLVLSAYFGDEGRVDAR